MECLLRPPPPPRRSPSSRRLLFCLLVGRRRVVGKWQRRKEPIGRIGERSQEGRDGREGILFFSLLPPPLTSSLRPRSLLSCRFRLLLSAPPLRSPTSSRRSIRAREGATAADRSVPLRPLFPFLLHGARTSLPHTKKGNQKKRKKKIRETHEEKRRLRMDERHRVLPGVAGRPWELQ